MILLRKYFSCRQLLTTKPLLAIAAFLCVIFVTICIKSNYSSWAETDCADMIANCSAQNQSTMEVENDNEYDFPLVEEMRLKSGERRFASEQVRCVGLSKQQRKTNLFQNPKLIYLATKFFHKINPSRYYFPNLGSKTFKRYSCPVSLCSVTNDPKRLGEADAVLFHVRDIDISAIPSFRYFNQLYILYSLEPPWLETLDFQRFEGFFNWTMSYRRGSDILVKYGFVGRRHANSTISKLSKTEFQYKEDKAVWYVSDCCTDGNREGFVADLMKYYPVQVLGRCGKIESCRPPQAKRCYQKVAQKYKFYFAFENALCQDYVTEKLFNALEFQIVPVVFGGVDYDEIAPPNSVINVKDFNGPKELAEYLWLVSNNYTLYASFFKWKKVYRAYLQPWMCDLCQKLHSPRTKISIKSNLKEWWNGHETCHRWTKKGFQTLRGHTFPCFLAKMLH